MRNVEDRILAWNPGATQLYGYPERDTLGMSFEALLPDEQREPARQLLAQLKAGGPFHSGQSQRLTKTGEQLPVHVTASAVYDDTGQPAAVTMIERPLTAHPAPPEEAR